MLRYEKRIQQYAPELRAEITEARKRVAVKRTIQRQLDKLGLPPYPFRTDEPTDTLVYYARILRDKFQRAKGEYQIGSRSFTIEDIERRGYNHGTDGVIYYPPQYWTTEVPHWNSIHLRNKTPLESAYRRGYKKGYYEQGYKYKTYLYEGKYY